MAQKCKQLLGLYQKLKFPNKKETTPYPITLSQDILDCCAGLVGIQDNEIRYMYQRKIRGGLNYEKMVESRY